MYFILSVRYSINSLLNQDLPNKSARDAVSEAQGNVSGDTRSEMRKYLKFLANSQNENQV